ncbi:CZB domain-containing protein [Candidatus Albibeggiatoa sp. nov. NOAA]|uniref:CZB domain-containing protein n=1 Tax=Candidatus Albibeggiatoa sp. nov. NOAA TaxID=3162724 RepID=UPI0032F154A1|nr:CZB domain-containing protein [Thiotrichaceae bacterium]
MTTKTFFMKRLNDHIHYLKELDAALKGESNFAGTDSHSCELGKWMHGEGKQEITHLHNPKAREIFESMFDIHDQFHKLGEEALSKKSSGDSLGAQMAITKMYGISAELTSKLLELDRIS